MFCGLVGFGVELDFGLDFLMVFRFVYGPVVSSWFVGLGFVLATCLCWVAFWWVLKLLL